jgi:hypothetical protein
MKPDFSGYATKAGVQCSDGLTIMPGAFAHQDQQRVPLVWQHGHSNVENVLGHAILEDRKDGVYAHAFFNDTKTAQHAKTMVAHKDVVSLSIWANGLKKRADHVMHGIIREVSLVLSGANPGALIEHVELKHADGSIQELDTDIIIHSGEELDLDPPDPEKVEDTTKKTEGEPKKDDSDTGDPKDPNYELGHAATLDENATLKDVIDSMNEAQKDVLNFMVGQALESAGSNSAEHSNLNQEGIEHTMSRTNVFETGAGSAPAKDRHIISHDAMKTIVQEGNRLGSLRKAVEEYAGEHLEHGITDIDQLFPDPRTLGDTPEWTKRRTEWVNDLLTSVSKSPFSRIRTMSADITETEARAKGYIKGTLKKEEFFSVARRVTTPVTIYKKQALDRDDIIDITDFDVVAWLKAEMRVMLDEELARAILIGDGRDISDEDKISESNIRPIAKDHELYTTVVNVNVNDASSSMNEVADAMLMNRSKLRGTGTPNFYTTETWIARFLMTRELDSGRRMYKNLEELAMELRVAKIIPVEVMEDEPELIGVLVNPVDYVLGADKGGAVSMFDDFDIDYNKNKYLIETRCSGALRKMKSAMSFFSRAGSEVLVAPVMPTFDPETGALTITDTAHIVYKNQAGTTLNNAGSPYTVPTGQTWTITAFPATGYYVATSDDDNWEFKHEA